MNQAVLHVVFSVGDSEYAMAAADVVQMDSYAGVTPVPGASASVAGLVQVRGQVIPAIDLRVRFGLPAREPTIETRLVVGTAGDRTVALVVDRAREVVRITPDQVKPPPRLVSERSEGYVAAVAQIGPRLIMLVDFEKVIGGEGVS
jgi:purine-binding chemotaxis protein CheW